MAGMEHLVSLKVMRVSRPSLASAWEPFYSSSPSFSAHSTNSIVSLQGKTALPGHPKTLRDLSHVTEMLMLPSSFGSIQLGETFTSCLSVNNEASVDIEFVTLTVEMQTALTKTPLAEIGGEGQPLRVGESLERVVSHEVKELGQHALACTVSYRLPPGSRIAPGTATDVNDPELQVFRKFYKFAVTNPLSVKTKVHVPRAPTALMFRSEREKVFLEIHIQNLTQDAMWLERMYLECADGWQAHNANAVRSKDSEGNESIFSGSMALMQPQDMRQYVYILAPTVLALFPVTHPPGSVVPLGRLDISWRSSFGEPGRLLTSMLSRRIPLVQPPLPNQGPSQAPPVPSKQPASAIPLHLQRSASLANASPPRPHSPQHIQRPSTPPAGGSGTAPYRPGSPFRNRAIGPAAAPSNTVLPSSSSTRRRVDVEVDLVVRHIPRESIKIEKPFAIAFTVNVSAPVPTPRPGDTCRARVLSLVVQHVQPPRGITASALPTSDTATARSELFSPPVLSSGFSTPSPRSTPHRADFQDSLAQRLRVASPRRGQLDEEDSRANTDGDATPPAASDVRTGDETVILPPPYTQDDFTDAKTPVRPSNVVFSGVSAVFLPQIRLTAPEGSVAVIEPAMPIHERNISTSTAGSAADSELENMAGRATVKVMTSQDFELSYISLRGGFSTIGGLRVVLVEDRLVEEGESSDGAGTTHYMTEPRVLKEWGVVGELWVES
ncbi:DUF974-domain-containing protein [Laetiporus sulphureus 93-53]|uniref:DUF974-domain-containing protein n=1 Tax=Laetiporus sulphureus 93-53 TaxID=1314785 RepID=A0A165CWE0_9APHY|nr:DUF974-domain-containing protein [Laetiporus sulphureus 93-53]KZT03573.1 DUF974-domain-containing protein [Laetiporus sulphureus 93-53]